MSFIGLKMKYNQNARKNKKKDKETKVKDQQSMMNRKYAARMAKDIECYLIIQGQEFSSQRKELKLHSLRMITKKTRKNPHHVR